MYTFFKKAVNFRKRYTVSLYIARNPYTVVLDTYQQNLFLNFFELFVSTKFII